MTTANGSGPIPVTALCKQIGVDMRVSVSNNSNVNPE